MEGPADTEGQSQSSGINITSVNFKYIPINEGELKDYEGKKIFKCRRYTTRGDNEKVVQQFLNDNIIQSIIFKDQLGDDEHRFLESSLRFYTEKIQPNIEVIKKDMERMKADCIFIKNNINNDKDIMQLHNDTLKDIQDSKLINDFQKISYTNQTNNPMNYDDLDPILKKNINSIDVIKDKKAIIKNNIIDIHSFCYYKTKRDIEEYTYLIDRLAKLYEIESKTTHQEETVSADSQETDASQKEFASMDFEEPELEPTPAPESEPAPAPAPESEPAPAPAPAPAPSPALVEPAPTVKPE